MSEPTTASDPGETPGPPDPELDAGIATFDAIAHRGAALIAAVTLRDGAPRVTRAWSFEVVDAARRRVRFALSVDDPAVVDALGHGKAAVTGADVATLESVQVKGPIVAVGPLTEADAELVEHHCALLVDVIHRVDGTSVEVLRRFLPTDLLGVELVVEEVYDQTPGPSAGSRPTRRAPAP